jgi:branched-subunit amino acid aminotransferase/4-amino-4-deoxychorismate lyase
VDEVFETMRIEDGRVRLVDRHLARLVRSGVRPERVEQAEAVIVAACCPDDHVVRADVWRDHAWRDHVLRVDVYAHGVVARPRPIRPTVPVDLVSIVAYDSSRRSRERKTQDRSWADVIETQLEVGVDREALLVDASGQVGETTRANVFAILRGELVTPPVEGLLPGVTRSWVVDRGASVRPLALTELADAEALFVTTAARGIVAVRTLDGRPTPTSSRVVELAARWLALP